VTANGGPAFRWAGLLQRAVLALVFSPETGRTTVSVKRHYTQLGHPSTDSWSGDVAGFADRVAATIEAELQKDTPAVSQPTGTAFTARAEILAVLEDAGYNTAAAQELLGRAHREPHEADPDPDFPETLAGGHALVLQYGDCEVIGSCQCGKGFGMTGPDASLDTFAAPWERHTTTELTAATPAIGAS
jgi:hypothetical protein